MNSTEIFSKLPKISPSMKNILLLTHTDLDGAGAYILLKAIANKANIEVQHCNNGVMSSVIRNCVTKNDIALKYDLIIACDISCNIADAGFIDGDANKYKFVLLDHHDTALALNQYDWACVQPHVPEDSFRVRYYKDENGNLNPNAHSSGTSLMYDYLEYCGLIGDMFYSEYELLQYFTHMTAAYDTWDWVEIFGKKAPDPYKLNKLFTTMGITKFEENMVLKMANAFSSTTPSQQIFDQTAELIMSIEEEKIKTHLESTRKSLINDMITLDNKTYSMVYCYTGRYFPETFDMMMEEYPFSQLYAINYGSGISLRTRDQDIHIGKLLENIGGGGHAGAGGAKIHLDLQRRYMMQALQAEITT